MWPKGPYYWIEDRLLRVSIPFTYNLNSVMAELEQHSMFWDTAEVGGPAVKLMPDFFSGMDWVTVGDKCEGILQRINPRATRTTEGCPNKCGYCAIGKGLIEPCFKVLDSWPEGDIYCDNNIFAAPECHQERVYGESIKRGSADFNQGLDARLLTSDHAEYLAAIDNLTARLALDGRGEREQWTEAVNTLVEAGVKKKDIYSYCLIGFNSDPLEAWQRCLYAEKCGVSVMPMWYHPLDSLVHNEVTNDQVNLGWTEKERTRIMGYFWYRRGSIPSYVLA